MSKFLYKCGIIIMVVLFCGGCSLFKNRTDINNEEAVVDEENRTITIVNKTNQVINELHVYVGEGTELMEFRMTNLEETSISKKLSKDYDKFEKFSIVLVDRYGLDYGKEDVSVKLKGNTEIIIDESNHIEKDGDFYKKIIKWVNGD